MTSRWNEIVFKCHLAAIGSAVFVVAIELVRLWLLASSPSSFTNDLFPTLLLLVGVMGAPLWFCGYLFILTPQCIVAAFHRAGIHLIARRASPSRTIAAFSYWCIVALIVTLVVQYAMMDLEGRFQRDIYHGLATGLVAALLMIVAAVLSAPITAILAIPIQYAIRALPRRCAQHGFAIWITFSLLAVILASFRAHGFIAELETVDLRPVRLVLTWIVALIAFHTLIENVRWHRLMKVGTLAFGALFLACFVGVFIYLPSASRHIITLKRDATLMKPLLSQFLRIFDDDRDGSPYLAHAGDCNDDNAQIFPGIYDTPDDGIDQNCTGEDLSLTKKSATSLPTSNLKTSEPKPTQIPLPQRESKPWNVVLITLDALRNDFVDEVMPNLAAMTRDSVRFTHAYSHGATTYWSLASLLTSKLPSRITMDRFQTPAPEEVLIAETLGLNQWDTKLFGNVTIFFVKGLLQGIQAFDFETSKYTVHGDYPGSEFLTDRLIDFVEERRPETSTSSTTSRRFFIWAHYYDPHWPYFAVPNFPAKDTSDRERYRAILRYTDHHLARFFAALKEARLWEQTLIVITSDHGEEFLDHGHRYHGRTLYEETIHVPLIFHVPDAPPQQIAAPVGHIDVAPTILELLGQGIPHAYEGKSQANAILGNTHPSNEPVFFEILPDSNYARHLAGVTLGHLKLICHVEERLFELYDLKRDPRERNNLYRRHPDSETLERILLRYVDRSIYELGQKRAANIILPPGTP